MKNILHMQIKTPFTSVDRVNTGGYTTTPPLPFKTLGLSPWVKLKTFIMVIYQAYNYYRELCMSFTDEGECKSYCDKYQLTYKTIRNEKEIKRSNSSLSR